MKKLQLLLVSVAMLSIFSCSDDDDDTLGVWYRRSDFDGRAREDAAGFVIGNRGYLCGGYRGKDQREMCIRDRCPTMQQPGMALPDSQ